MGQDVLSNDTIKQMHSAGLGDDLIISTIASHPGNFSTTVSEMIALKNAGISDKIIAAMAAKGHEPSAPSAGAVPAVPVGAVDPTTLDTASGAAKPRVFLTSASHGTNRNAARDQSMEMSKDFERDCPEVRITLNQSMADYTVSLNHIEVGLFVRDNQFQVADKNGDLISKTKEGGSIAGGIKKLVSCCWPTGPNLIETRHTIRSPGDARSVYAGPDGVMSRNSGLC